MFFIKTGQHKMYVDARSVLQNRTDIREQQQLG